MGIRAKILLFVGILLAVALIQIGISIIISRSMGRKLSAGTSNVVTEMGDSIRRNERARVGNSLLANTSELKATVSDVERATIMASDFIRTAVAFARTSDENRKLAEKEIERFCESLLKERMPFISGIGFTFELDGFSPSRRHFLPYAYREGNSVVYSDDVEPPSGADPESLSQDELDSLVRQETSQDYYTKIIPPGHDLSRPLPLEVKWTTPYIDETTKYLMMSAVTPISYDGRIVGVTFLDMALTDLDSMTKALAATLTPNSRTMIFDYISQRVVSAPGLSEWAPELVDDPANPGSRIEQPSSLGRHPVGRRVQELATRVEEDHVENTSYSEDNDEYTLFVGNVHDQFGVMALLPNSELFAETERALVNAHKLEDVQDAEIRKIRLIGFISLFVMALVGVLIAIFVIRLTRELGKIIGKLNRDADGVSLASGTINELATSLASDTANQAAELASTAASLNQISAKVKTNADASETCDRTMHTAMEHVNVGNRQMDEMHGAMVSIAESSEKISDIIKTIESISFQTNLLALNAAVEASRAGEAGKGFAVVADEVRSLAGRSAQASRETEALIAETSERVNRGAQSVETLRDSFKNINSGVSEAAQWVERIRESTSEQADAISTINSSVSNLDTAVKRNEQASGESASTSSELAGQATSLAETASSLSALALGKRRSRK